jgi:hypothetical protein
LSEFPEFKLPIADRHEAEFWLFEWRYRLAVTRDLVFKEQVDAMRKYIDRHFDVEDE